VNNSKRFPTGVFRLKRKTKDSVDISSTIRPMGKIDKKVSSFTVRRYHIAETV
jgi:hypothetical protein